jgi:hypothetical protein
MTAYFSGDARALMASGEYRPISKLKSGNMVVNMDGKSVKVMGTVQTSDKQMVQITHRNWYKPFYCTETQEILADGRWVRASEVRTERVLTAPTTVKVSSFNKTVADETVSYNLGALFGLYCGYGGINNGKVQFVFGPNDEIDRQVCDTLKELFDVTAEVERNEKIHRVTVDDPKLIELFSEFGSKVDRRLPGRWCVADNDYMLGIFTGIVEYDRQTDCVRYICISEKMVEIFLDLCRNLGYTVVSERCETEGAMSIYLLKVDDKVDGSDLVKVGTDSLIARDAWSVVVDCPTRSMDVDNMVVRTKD